MTDFYDDMKDVADELIEEFGATVTITRTVLEGTEYDPTEGTPLVQTTKGVEVTEDVRARDNGLADGVTAVYLCTVPADFALKIEDEFLGFGRTSNVVWLNEIKPGDVKVVVEVGIGA